MGYAHAYADAILHRGRVPMEPADFVPNWADKPRKGKFYPDAPTFPLPEPGPADDALAQAGLFGTSGDAAFTLPLLADMLLDSYGLTGRRLGVTANTDLDALPFYPHANWSRGTSSGGGLYPVSVYWVSGAGGPVTPGVYYYATGHHAMQRLLTGDVTERVRAAVGDLPAARETDQFLVVGVKYWQNAFKYNSFSFHAVSMDVGAAVQSWRIWARARGLRVEPALWFDEAGVADLLGVDAADEGMFAVIPLAWAGTGDAPAAAPTGPGPRVLHTDVEQSRTVLTFDTLQRIHQATTADCTTRPAPAALQSATARTSPAGDDAPEPVTLPAPTPLTGTVREAVRRRRSSFGRFSSEQPLTGAELSCALAACAATSLDSDATGPHGPRLTTLYAFVNHVEGVPPGSYRYDPEQGALHLVAPGPPGRFLQDNYFLANYNLEQAGAVLVPTVRTTAVLDAVGDRGYRLVNGTVGAVAQTFYTTASALGLGGGVALGFDNISYQERLHLVGTDEAPLLIMLLGRERQRPADFRYEIV